MGTHTKDIQRVCAQCQTPFLTSQNILSNSRGMFCSKTCASNGKFVEPTIKHCKNCGISFAVGGKGRKQLQTVYCSTSCAGHSKIKETHRATQPPTARDIAWASGFYEGEGTASKSSSVSILQVNLWPLSKMQVWFGGAIDFHDRNNKNPKHADCYMWRIHGPRARGFLMTIYQFLSPRRKLQARMALEQWKTT